MSFVIVFTNVSWFVDCLVSILKECTCENVGSVIIRGCSSKMVTGMSRGFKSSNICILPLNIQFNQVQYICLLRAPVKCYIITMAIKCHYLAVVFEFGYRNWQISAANVRPEYTA